jgi:hypothetical protein
MLIESVTGDANSSMIMSVPVVGESASLTAQILKDTTRQAWDCAICNRNAAKFKARE